MASWCSREWWIRRKWGSIDGLRSGCLDRQKQIILGNGKQKGNDKGRSRFPSE
jgi:hypothetical protein